MIQQRDHLTLQHTEHTPESTHLNVPFIHKTKGLPVFYVPHPTCGLSALDVALKLDFLLLPAFPRLTPEPGWAQTPSAAATAELLLKPVPSPGSVWFPTALICSDLGTSAPTVPLPLCTSLSPMSLLWTEARTPTEIAPCIPENRVENRLMAHTGLSPHALQPFYGLRKRGNSRVIPATTHLLGVFCTFSSTSAFYSVAVWSSLRKARLR